MKPDFIGIGTAFLLTMFLLASTVHANYILYNNKKELNEPPAFTGIMTYHDEQTKRMTAKYQYVNGEKNGPYKEWDAQTGELTEEGTFSHDQFDGVRKTYQDGKPVAEMFYDKGQSTGIQKQYVDGVLSRVYLLLKDSESTDTELYFNKKGQLTSLHCGTRQIGAKDAEWCGRNGKLSTVTLYDEDGRVSATVQYLRGLQSGVARKFNVVTEKVMTEEHYEKGKLLENGQKHFNSEGILLSKIDCDNSQKSCTETIFFEDGKQEKQVKVRKGGMIIRQTEYYQNGKRSYERVVQGDHFQITDFYDSGKIEKRGAYEAGVPFYGDPFLPDGVIELFYEDGTLQSRENYINGQLQGQSDIYRKIKKHMVHEELQYKKDKLVSKKVFVDDKPIMEAEYMPDGSIKSRKEFGKIDDPDLEI